MAPIGLRGRITLLVVGVVAFCLATVFAAVYRGTASRLNGATDTGLREDLAELRHAVAEPTPALILKAARSFIARQPSRATTHVLFVTRGPRSGDQRAGAARHDTRRPR